MVFKVIDRISNSSPNALVNEDAVGATSAGAWVIDGATGVSDRPPLVAGTTDAAWLAGQLNAELQATCDGPDVDPVEALIKVEATIRAAFIAVDEGLSMPASEQPSAAFALAAVQENILHLIGIADCRIIYEQRTGAIGEFNPSDTGMAEAHIIAERDRLVAEHPGEDPWPRLKGFIRTLRELANQDGGYSVVHPTRAWSNRVRRQIHEVDNIRHLLLVSDGFFRLVDVFGAMAAAGLLERALAEGLAPLFSELRELERADVESTNFRCIKTHDDASAILVTLTE